ncbi:MAG: hypothetical protein ABJH68_18835 [Ilumatobacter sp.]|uniref:ArnT family glycosyltransferase n=1 Tax=Ilumatobacter sp. TaxID=1967498 RepID=UPI003297C631
MPEQPEHPVVCKATSSSMSQSAYRRCLGGVLAAAAVFRIGYVLAVKGDDPLVGDEGYYHAQAVVIANGQWFENPFPPGGFAADHVPLTALWLSLVSWVDDRSILAQRLLMASTGVFVVGAVAVLARIVLGRRASLGAAAIAGGYGAFWLNDVVLMSETLATGAVVAVLCCAYVYRERRSWRWAAALGVAVGVAGLARAELLVLGALVAIGMTLLDRGGRAGRPDVSGPPSPSVRWTHLALAGVVSLAVLAPWVIRNQVRFDESTIMSTQDGLTVLGANCPPAYRGDFVGFWAIECAETVEVDDGADQSVRSAAYRAAGLDYAVEHADELPAVALARVGRGVHLFRPDQMTRINELEGRARWASWIATVQFWLLAPIALSGLTRWASPMPRWPLIVTVGFTLVLFAAVYGIPRLRVPLDVAFVLAAAAAVDGWWSRRSVATRPTQS